MNSMTTRIAPCLEAQRRHNGTIRAMITPMPEQAEAALAAGVPNGALAGMPVSVKDNIDTAGTRTTRGSGFFADHVPDADATVVQRLRRAGAVIVGKDNMHEFAFGGTSQNPHHGLCRNPWNIDAIPGGSSGGSGAGIAAGFAEVALGSDTGGSVRIPAALNGVTGLRPTVGRVSNHGCFPVSARFDTVGPLARGAIAVADCYEVIAGYDAADPYSVDRPVEGWRSRHAAGLAGLRIGLPRALIEAEATPEVAALLAAAAEALAGLGAVVGTVVLPPLDGLNAAYMTLVQADAATVHRARLAAEPGRFGTDVAGRMAFGGAVPVQDYAQALTRQALWMRQMEGVFAGLDLLAMPTVGFGAPLASEAPDMMALTHRMTRLTAPWSFAELPGLSLPCGLTAAGLPVGLQLVGPKWSEALLLATGIAFQGVTAHHVARPPLCSPA
jgi:aspartyl-tRNA(Asn)/glutamyl-tRNA(Gln) amidotransferase subunit A